MNSVGFVGTALMQPWRKPRKALQWRIRTVIQRYRKLIALLLQILAFGLAAPAIAAPVHIAADLLVESAAMPGQTLMLAVRMRPESGWHGYWQNPGDAGIGMTLAWTLPAGFKTGSLQYPVPDTLLLSGLMNHVFEHDYTVLVPLTVPTGAIPGSTIPLRAQASWLACTDQICVPEQGALTATLVIGPSTKRDSRFDAWRTALPAPLGSAVRFSVDGQTLRLAIPLPATAQLELPHLFVADQQLIDYAGIQSFSRQGDLLLITLPRAKFQPRAPASLTAVLRLNRAGDGVSFAALPGPVPTGGVPIAGKGPATPPPGLPWLLLSALLGGLLLNIMPCVFPILSLKALSLARAGDSARQARAEGLAYAAGVVLACAGLGALLLALRGAGQQVGWAFQLQEPFVVVALLLLATAITANLAGLFEMAIPAFARTGSRQGAFATGLLAAFVATPCTGPFMAAAMGAALLLPLGAAMALFVMLGIGLALPFLAIAFIPALRRALPRPGAWMVWFRKIMAVPMAITALALLWLCWRLGGELFALGTGIAATAVLAALVALGQAQRAGKSAIRQFGLATALLVAAVLLLPNLVRYVPVDPIDSILPTRPFSEQALARARSTGRPVFLYFTADWCLTCKVNEKAAIERDETRDAFAKAGVQVLAGDWTRRDPAISRFLTAQGAAGVPLYLWYQPGSDGPDQLPQVLTSALLAEKAGGRRP